MERSECLCYTLSFIVQVSINSIALRKTQIVYNFGLSECSRVKVNIVFGILVSFCVQVSILTVVLKLVFNSVSHKVATPVAQ